jgi:hypothetical protein
MSRFPSLSAATATCSIAGFDNKTDVALSVYDYLVNHPDEIPEPLNDDDLDSDAVVHLIESYLEIDSPGILTIHYFDDNVISDQNDWSSDVFDFLTEHFACLQTSHFMEVNWISFNGCCDPSSGTNYYGQDSKLIDIKSILNAHFAPAIAGE